jgi:hypothetical protein
MGYNGWDNYETWKFNLEVLDGWDLEELMEFLGYERGEEMPIDYSISNRLKDQFSDFIDLEEGSDFLKEWARVSLDSVNYMEIAKKLRDDIRDLGYFG